MINNTEYKTCNICGLIKKYNEFYNTDTRCKICKSEYQKQRRLINKEKKIEMKKKEELNDKILKNICNYYESKIDILEKEIKTLHRKLNIK